MIISGVIAAWREVKLIVMGLVSLSFIGIGLKHKWLTATSTVLLGWVFYFFRDPERFPEMIAPDIIFSPADGRIIKIEQVNEPEFMQGECQRITIFLSLFNVHVQHTPYPGVVKFIKYQSGGFAPALFEHADDNESNSIGMVTQHGPLIVKPMAGLLARRIVCKVDLEDQLELGQRLSLIKFGSRVDLFLPTDKVELLVQAGQTVFGGQTAIARWR
ncbi:phosphatidylserine decarboxylase [Anaerolineales bacterium HSG24]|nr:phosphatidylserine decarboxylase [Anaerolineales bacterium HSG24]